MKNIPSDILVGFLSFFYLFTMISTTLSQFQSQIKYIVVLGVLIHVFMPGFVVYLMRRLRQEAGKLEANMSYINTSSFIRKHLES